MANTLKDSLPSPAELKAIIESGRRESGSIIETLDPNPSWTRANSSCERCGGDAYRAQEDGPDWKFFWCPECVEKCGRCAGEGWIHEPDEHGIEYALRCPECTPIKAAVSALNRAHLPVRYDPGPIRPRSQEQRDILRFIAGWCTRFRPRARGWLLAGPVGVGKSQLLVTTIRKLAEEYAAKRVTFMFLHIGDLVSAMKGAMSRKTRDADSPEDILGKAKRVDVLAIDEVSPLSSQWQEGVLEELLTLRYQWRLTTIGSTNLTSEEMSSIASGEAGDRISSRIAEWMPPIDIGGPDLRLT